MRTNWTYREQSLQVWQSIFPFMCVLTGVVGRNLCMLSIFLRTGLQSNFSPPSPYVRTNWKRRVRTKWRAHLSKWNCTLTNIYTNAALHNTPQNARTKERKQLDKANNQTWHISRHLVERYKA